MPSRMGLKDNMQNFIFNASIEWKPMEMVLDVEYVSIIIIKLLQRVRGCEV